MATMEVSKATEKERLRRRIADLVNRAVYKGMNGPKPVNTQRRAEALAFILGMTESLLSAAGDIDALNARASEEALPHWDAVWALISSANSYGKTLLAMEGDMLGMEVCCEDGGLVGRVTSVTEEYAQPVTVRVGNESYTMPPNHGYPVGHFPAEYYFRKSGSDAYDWGATAELLLDLAERLETAPTA